MSLLLDSEETFVTLCQSMSIDIRIQKAIMRLGHVRPTLVQSKCLPLAISSGRDLLVRARTGSGKTLAYCIPILQKLLSSSPPPPPQQQVSNNNVCTSVRAVILVPTRELCAQIHQVLLQLIYYCSDKVTIAVLSVGQATTTTTAASKKHPNGIHHDEFERQEVMLRDQPDIIIATPNALLTHIRRGSDPIVHHHRNDKKGKTHPPLSHRSNNSNQITMSIDLKSSLEILVIDEADLILSFGYSNDLQEISTTALPRIYQGMLLSATLNPEMDQLKKILLHTPVIVKLEQEDDTIHKASPSGVMLKQFYIALPNKDKNLVLYVFIKLGLLKGKGLFFVNTTDAGYRLKLFFEQFHIRSAVLNAELPFRSRMNIIEQYNIGNFDYLIATDTSTDAVAATTKAMSKSKNQSDDGDYNDDENDDGDNDDDPRENEDESVKEMSSAKIKASAINKSKRIVDSGYGVSRGLDFRNVSFVVNVDLPPNPRSYAHRIGRTARGGAKGVALSLIDIHSTEQLQMLHDIQDSQPRIPIIGASTETLNAATTFTTVATDDRMTMNNQFDQPQPVPLDFNLQEIEGFRYRVEDVSRAVTRSAVRETRAAELKAEILNSERLQAHFAEHPNDLQILAHDRIATHVSKVQEHLKHVPKYLLPRGMQVANLSRRKKKRVNKRGRTGGERRSDNDPLQTFDSDVHMDGVHGSDDAENKEDPYADFLKDDDDVGTDNIDGIATKKQKLDPTKNDKVFTNTKDGTGQSTAGRSAWKEKHKKGKFSSKKRLVDRKYKAPLGI
jgi:ATP-dependent RNA helicase DDX56/DBP9